MPENPDPGAAREPVGSPSSHDLKAQMKAARKVERQNQGWLRRNRLWVILGGLFTLAVVAVGGLALLGGVSEPDYSDLASMDVAAFEPISQKDWSAIEKNPDKYIDKKVIVFAEVTQFDVSTGESSFRGNSSAVQPAESYEFDSNTIFQGDPALLKDLGNEDIVKVHGVIAGAEEYETMIGGTATAIIVHVSKIENVGFADLTKDIKILERSKPDEYGESTVKVQVTNSGVSAKSYGFSIVARSKSGNDELGAVYFSTSALKPGETVTLKEGGLYDVPSNAKLIISEVTRN